ncbi:hypothetical protein M231_07898 [Tremella mesenterica]|uniref:CCHC-type domain-containing protein n=1 Tax=Tremella mesenterica TaxID=5217 RepID=A0A4Q1BAZ0_TREME|nr:hypothetical protein M231_07898 [Tremella mesenterica]
MSENNNTTHLTAEQAFQAQQDMILQLQAQINALQVSSTIRPEHVKEPKISHPPPFTGRKDQTLEFLAKCNMVFTVQPRTYSTDITRIAFATNLLKDEAYRWVLPYLGMEEGDRPLWLHVWNDFQIEFKKYFGDSNLEETSRFKLRNLRQTGSASVYATEFQRHAAYVHWNDDTKKQNFFDGLKDDVKDRLLAPSKFKDYETLVSSAIEYDDLLYQRRRSNNNPRTQSTTIQRFNNNNINTTPRYSNNTRTTSTPKFNNTFTPRTTSTTTFTPTPMEIDATQSRPNYGPISPAEREYRMKNNLCNYCGKPGHKAFECRAAKHRREQKAQVSATTTADTKAKNSQPQA